ncbi:Sec-independent protein translocase protein TatB [Oceanicoccus sagamiensis]|uniref:Sec-independent protein translocase protein TatB n=1 Tax=Oceanicoccus sagamiensis TaxID=716816 RepID=A0A1X9NAW5_9GAMM|nr:Sec-independent protein translocase protein TatB [Oceanicoccus sagamiensis]ARN74194.1 twin arginine-targeting protein translocase TatB [Oceanicoccus sagamiensis]
MFDIGFLELLLIGILSLLIMGPERLPGAVRSATLFISRIRRSFNQIKSEIEREVGADEIKQQIHNETIMESLAKTKSDLQDSFQETAAELKPDLDKLQYDVEDIISADENKSTDDKPQT